MLEKTMFVTLYFIPVLYLHVWIRIHKTPKYGSITLHIKAWENIGSKYRYMYKT